MIKIASFLQPDHVFFIDAETRDQVILDMVEMMDKKGLLKDKDLFYRAIVDREAVVSTGIGMGVAIPHAKLLGYQDFFIAIGILSKGVSWNSLDDQPVRLVFMIGGPDDKQTEYLQILSALTLALKDEGRRKEILKATTPDEILSHFEEF